MTDEEPDRQRADTEITMTVDLWEDGHLVASLITELESVPVNKGRWGYGPTKTSPRLFVDGENRPATKEEIGLLVPKFSDVLGRISPTSWVRFAIPID